MKVIELEQTTRWSVDCGECGCNFTFTNPEDVVDVITYVTVADYDGDLDGYTDWDEREAYKYDTNFHDCGCGCDGTWFHTYQSDERWEVGSISTYKCGECEREYASLSQASECCRNEVDKLTPERLLEEMIQKGSVRKN